MLAATRYAHALGGCETISYPYPKGKVTALNTMVSGIHQASATIGDVGTTHTKLMNTTIPFCVAL